MRLVVRLTHRSFPRHGWPIWYSDPEPGSIAPSYAAVSCEICGATNGLVLVDEAFRCRDGSFCARYLERAKKRKRFRGSDLRTLSELVNRLEDQR